MTTSGSASCGAARRHGPDATNADVLALLYDVHGNLPALEAVIADAEAAGARRLDPRRRLRAVRRLAGGDRRAAAQARAGDAGSAATASAGPPTRTRRPTTRWCPARSPRRARRSARTLVARPGRAPVALAEDGRAGLPRLAAQRRPLVRARRRADDDDELLDGDRRAAGDLRPHARPVPRRRRGRRSSSSTRARWACRSTATRARPTRCSPATGRIEHRRVGYDHAASAERVRGLGGEWAEVVARRIERATIDA